MNYESEKERLERELNIRIEESYDSREDENPDEQDGHFKAFEVVHDRVEAADEYDTPLILQLYESGTFQFFWDATPIATRLNTSEESREMMMALNPFPKPIGDLNSEVLEDVFAYLEEIV